MTENAALLSLATRSVELQRKNLEAQYAVALTETAPDAGLIRAIRAELKRVDRNLQELAAGRMPTL